MGYPYTYPFTYEGGTLVLGGAGAGDRVHLRLFRDSTDGSDTYATDALYRHGALMEI